MFFISIIVLTILIPLIQSGKPSLKLTFNPDEPYYASDSQVEIICEMLNFVPGMESPQLWHIDLRTGRHTTISRQLILAQTGIDIPEMFQKTVNKRIDFVKKNHIRIRHLQLEDSSQFGCNCPDCAQPLDEQNKLLQIVKSVEPKWHVEPGWPMQEKAKTKIRCTVDDFYPYVSHRITLHHHDITSQGNHTVGSNNVFPQRFSWEADVEPADHWHDTSLECFVTQGKSEQRVTKHLEVLFTPRFVKCDEKQYVNLTQENATIECSYSGNPAPILTWLRQSDEKPLKSETGITIETKDEHHGKYKSIVTFDREKLIALPLPSTPSTTTIKSMNEKSDTTLKSKSIVDNYYEQLLHDGFIVKLSYNNEEKGVRKISIASSAKEARTLSTDNASTKIIIQSTWITMILLLILTFI